MNSVKHNLVLQQIESALGYFQIGTKESLQQSYAILDMLQDTLCHEEDDDSAEWLRQATLSLLRSVDLVARVTFGWNWNS